MRMRDVAQSNSRTAAYGWWLAIALAFLPFLFVSIPPLTDAPGHLAQLAVQTASPNSPLRGYFGFHWVLELNLGTDLLVGALEPLLGLERAFWLVTASIPPLTALAILGLARTANRGAAAASWALPFAYAYPFNFGFLNYALAMALSFLAFALWIALRDRPVLREILFWPIIPTLLVAHAIGGGLLPVMILADTLARRGGSRSLVRELRPLAAAIPVVVLWKLEGTSGEFDTVFSLSSKINAVVFALRDQDRLLDIASVMLVIAVPLVGRLLGARYTRTGGAVVAGLILLFLVTPNEFGGSSYADTRLIPAVAIAALALQDWSAVARRWAIAIAVGGFALFGARMAVTADAFAAYARSYASERAALPHVVPGSRVLALVTRQCRASRAWRSARLDHFPALAIVDRQSWTNALWDVPGIHLLEVRFRPSPDFYDDPSHYVWPADCVTSEPAPRTAEERRNQRRTIEQTAPMLPLDRVDYLWLIDTRLSRTFDARGLKPVWSNGRSTLYRVIRPAAPTRH